jgi:hypothetical protein
MLVAWAKEFKQRDCTLWLYPKSNIDEDEWSKNCPNNGGNGEHVKPKRTPFKKKTNCPP